MIIIYNRNKEQHMGPNNYPIFRGGSVLGNPYTHIKDKQTKASFVVRTREEAIEKYDRYFDIMYSGNLEFKKLVDEIYTKYVNGEDVYLECYCAPEPCHGEVIKKKLEQRLLKERIREHLERKKLSQNENIV